MYATSPRGAPPDIEAGASLRLRGQLSEPVRNISEVEFLLFPTDQVEPGRRKPPAIGAIVQIRPHVEVVVNFAHHEFDRIWTLAFAGRLRYAYMVFTKPHYSSALVTNVSFSTHPEE